ncbi:MAG: hypothetical protein ACJ0HA_03040 [Dehalococcoidia bacterium]|tara:strand:+ start:409 stop:531 length:123 start_codon:yes stop_codon:yes gene_type:complete
MRNFKRDKELVGKIYLSWFLLGILYLFFGLTLNPLKQIGN